MKFVKLGEGLVGCAVAPSHEGAWIEIRLLRDRLHHGRVAPSHEGAWIEIELELVKAAFALSPPHTRGRGLKFTKRLVVA